VNYLSVCSGIEAATVAWHPLGWNPVGFSDIEKFPSEVLNHHYPNVTNFGDMTKYKEWNLGTVDLLVGGTPCQSFSVAGLRKGLEDPRGNLALVYCGILDHFRPKWFVWENVPGVLSSGGGRDFGSFLGAVAELGYGFAYRVLDAQYFGVAQRRRRVFVVGCLGDWRSAAAVLFEPDSLRRDNPPSREKREKTTASARPSVAYGGSDGECSNTVTSKWAKGSGGPAGSECGLFVAQTVYETHPVDSRVKEMGDVCQTVTSRWGTGGGNVPIALEPIPYRKSKRAQSADDDETWVDGEVSNTINLFDQGDIRTTHAVVQPIALAENTIGRQPHNGGNGDGFTVGGPMYTLNATGVHGVVHPVPFGVSEKPDVAHCLRSGASKADKHESTTYVAQPIPLNSMNCFRSPEADPSTGCGIGEEGEAMFTITKTNHHAVAQPICFSSNMSVPDCQENMSPALKLGGHGGNNPPAVAVDVYNQTIDGNTAATLTEACGGSNTSGPKVMQPMQTNMAVRRLTPVECERLQGFPDNYTNIPWRKSDESPDGPRYKALGNSMAVPVMAWIGRRIQEVEAR
jgi:DNA (cytosine-5)-methyltransferase 1